MARETRKKGGVRWRLWFALAALASLCAGAGMAALRVRRYALSNEQFTFSPGGLEIRGRDNGSEIRVRRVFALDSGRSVFAIPLAERRRRLLAIDWVDDASVSRIWPNGLLVRIRERQPVAIIPLRTGAVLIDAEGVLLERPPEVGFRVPVLTGVREDQPEAERRERVAALLRFQQDMGAMAQDAFEVDIADPGNLWIFTRSDGRLLSLQMGGADFARHYRNFLAHYPEIHKGSPDVHTFDLRSDGRIVAKE
jgi:cell division protein FtsQ